MAIEPVRVVLVPKGADEETAADLQIVIDMKLDTETKVSSGPFPAFGRIGNFKKNETLFPITLMMDGRLDTGAYAADAQREDMLELRTAKLVAGEDVAYVKGGTSVPYVISSVSSLLEIR